MTRDQDIDRVLDQWFTEGPTQMPSRFLDETLDRIDGAPQRRLARLQTRVPAMNPNLRFAAAAAVVVIVVGLGAAVVTRTGRVGSTPAAGSSALPATLQGEWSPVGVRLYPLLSAPNPGIQGIVIGPTTLSISDHVDVLSSASLVEPGRLELRALNNGKYWHCQVGDVGTYTFSLTNGNLEVRHEDGRVGSWHLNLSPVSDACAERATILAGAWFPSDIGELIAGFRHEPHVFRPFGGDTGQLTYTVPTGWAEIEENASSFMLAKRNLPYQEGIRLLSNVVPSTKDAACHDVSPDSSRTPDAIAAWLRTVPGLVVSRPTAVTIGGLSGVMLDLSVASSWTSTCASGFVYTFSALDMNGKPSPPLGLDGGMSVRTRYVLLDRGDGSTLVIDIEAPDSEWNAFITEAMPIVQNFEFTR